MYNGRGQLHKPTKPGRYNTVCSFDSLLTCVPISQSFCLSVCQFVFGYCLRARARARARVCLCVCVSVCVRARMCMLKDLFFLFLLHLVVFWFWVWVRLCTARNVCIVAYMSYTKTKPVRGHIKHFESHGTGYVLTSSLHTKNDHYTSMLRR